MECLGWMKFYTYEIQELLEVLGFPKGSKKLPKMKEVRKQFLKLSLIRHPDKPTGSNKDMSILLNAYKKKYCHLLSCWKKA